MDLIKTTTNAIEIIKERLYWISDTSPPKCKNTKAFYFCIDDNLVYEPFFEDFGPLNLAMTHKYCMEVEKIMNNIDYKKYKIYHYTSTLYNKRANAAYLMGAYLLICQNKTAEEAWSFFENIQPSFRPFRDAISGSCTYECTIYDCLRGLEYAMKLGWYNPKTFNFKEYEEYEKVDNGDLNWIIPNKFLAFSTPYNSKTDDYGYQAFTPEDYVPIFKKWKVGLVVRLNNKTYDKEKFEKNGINHMDLYFIDGSTPPDDIINNFLKFSEKEKNGIAVHCKAGLGRTGTLIAIFAMKHYRFPADAFIGYIRICRPGSILGPQQQFLCDVQDIYFKKGEEYRKTMGITDELCLKLKDIKLSKKDSIMSKQDYEIMTHGDSGQGDRLKKVKNNK